MAENRAGINDSTAQKGTPLSQNPATPAQTHREGWRFCAGTCFQHAPFFLPPNRHWLNLALSMCFSKCEKLKSALFHCTSTAKLRTQLKIHRIHQLVFSTPYYTINNLSFCFPLSFSLPLSFYLTLYLCVFIYFSFLDPFTPRSLFLSLFLYYRSPSIIPLYSISLFSILFLYSFFLIHFVYLSLPIYLSLFLSLFSIIIQLALYLYPYIYLQYLCICITPVGYMD